MMDDERNTPHSDPEAYDSADQLGDEIVADIGDDLPDSDFANAGDDLADEPIVEASEAPIAPLSAEQIRRDFDELTLADVLGQFFYAPRDTVRAFWNAIQTEPRESYYDPISTESSDEPVATLGELVTEERAEEPPTEQASWMRFAQLALYFAAILMAVWGGTIMVVNAPQRFEDPQLIEGFRRFVWAGLLWLAGEIVVRRETLLAWLGSRTRNQWLEVAAWGIVSFITLVGIGYWLDASDELLLTADDKARVVGIVGQGAGVLLLAGIGSVVAFFATRVLRRQDRENFGIIQNAPVQHSKIETIPWYMRIHPARVFLVMLGTLFSTVTWFNSANNEMTTVGFVAWSVSIVCWAMAFAPRSWWNVPSNVRRVWHKWQNFNVIRNAWVIVALVVITLVAAHFRLSNLNGSPNDNTAIPQEMTSDHVEKLLDAQRVKEGSRNIFFANNGGREPIQMYLMAMFSELPGQGINHESLKLLSVIESLLTMPFFFWLGWDLFRTESRLFRQLMGIVVAALVAVSFWDTTIARMGLRIILTPLVTIFVLVYLSRAMRSNQIGDFIKTGLALGLGLYAYQAVRMIPIVIVMAAVLTFVWGLQRWAARRTLVLNMMALIVVSFMTFLPMYHYTTEHPDLFLRRTFGRLLGDEVVEERLPSGIIVQRQPTFQEQMTAFVGNLPVLFGNLRNAVLMFNWKGDILWFTNYPNFPALDRWSGAFFAVGCVAWLVLAIRRRDLVYVMIPLALAIMLLPSALSIAYPIENPSFTRTSGAMPMTYLIAALPLVLVVEAILKWERSRLAKGLAAAVVVVPIVGAYSLNYNTYMKDFAASYIPQSLPHSEGGRILREFVEQGGSYGNAFLIASVNWWDHRAVGLASGLEGKWLNGVYDTDANDSTTYSIDYLPSFMQQAISYPDSQKFDVDKDILVFYNKDDLVTSATLREWFPTGVEILYPSYQPGDEFYVFRAPALGMEGVAQFLQAHAIPGQ
jgi:hypothetical protein